MRILPADSLPITNVIGNWCFTALFSVLFAVERKDRRDTRGNGIFNVQERLEARVERAPALDPGIRDGGRCTVF